MPPESSAKKDEWFKDMLRYGQSFWVGILPIFIFVVIAIVAGILLPALAKAKSAMSGKQVVVYTSQDQMYAEPVLKDFEKESGIRVRAVYDSEAVKTVGLANRLLAEKNRPQCDVFWSNEELRTRQLAAKEVFRKTNAWATVGYRSRRLVINTNKVALGSTPQSLSDLTNARWNGKVALAYPLFGTTAAHFLALRQSWGEDRWLAWCRALASGRPFVVDGNSVVVKLVGRGEAWIGMTDSDDIAAEFQEGAPIVALPLSDESLLIASTVAVVREAPHPESAQALYDYLRRPEVTQRLVDQHALELVSVANLNRKTLQPDWNRVLGDLESGTEALKQIFLR